MRMQEAMAALSAGQAVDVRMLQDGDAEDSDTGDTSIHDQDERQVSLG